ncbi:alpha/beta hydrolase [Bacillus pseudomycoides]|uniref:Alpha/beta hydrolase n=1 Tax=Bacillus pseudomycoides TaxID=64104 RepID=A0AA91V9V2_9BACI|nr:MULTISPECIES: alpha/beta hydrolase [Bacillus]PEB51552.1 alpha/beta hydrolase [Bacillus sp. AFS098217]PED80733.1 alpha/beta hydrolase [Bacillus pseudomycoides]PEU07359.1 alpha/beta hydrolase [Bacillus sp. AFS019443]PEU18267.1 alpha/beta hydrolase [Bacillus sp. AFS014408]PFW60658.1 alpha/beta hydrolase [Bacillus sp. AFS075034]
MSNTTSYVNLVSKLSEEVQAVKKRGFDFIAKPIPDSDATCELDPRVLQVTMQTAEKMAAMESEPFDPSDTTSFVQGMRAMMGWNNDNVTKSKVETTYKTIDGTNGPIPLRIYTPSNEGILPAVVFIHGGGFIGGSVDVVENPCKSLAEKAGAVVISVDYRLAPEHPYPAGLTDCFEAVTWVYNHAEEIRVNPQQIAVSGDSAGGNLATVCALMDIEKGTGMIKLQALIYPTVNMACVQTEDFNWSLDQYEIRNHSEFIIPMIEGLAGSGDLFFQLYLQSKAEITDPHVSPLLSDQLSNMPQTLIATAEFDYLKVECEAYAAKLTRSGVPTKLIQYNGVDHAFMDKIGLYPQAEDLMNEIAKEVKRVFA